MIRKFNQFVSENDNRPISRYREINEPFVEFVDRIEKRVKNITERITEMVGEMDNAINLILDDFADNIVGEPVITVDSDMEIITAKIHTNIPNNDEAWEADESAVLDLEKSLNRDYNDIDIYIDIDGNPDEDGNCVIVLHKDILIEKYFGEYTDVIARLGEE